MTVFYPDVFYGKIPQICSDWPDISKEMQNSATSTTKSPWDLSRF